MSKRFWQADDGVISFEWILLLTLLTIGIVTGVAATRDATIDEFGDIANAMLAVDQSFSIDFPLNADTHPSSSSGSSNSIFRDGFTFVDCSRTNSPVGQTENAMDGE